MRTTVRLNERLLAEAKKHAAEVGTTLTALLEEALRETLARRTSRPKTRRIRLKTVKGSGLRPGVDLDDSATLLDLMEN
jgi:DNA repair photolyase